MKTFRPYYGWYIVGVSFLTVFLALGIRASFGLFYVSILNEYHWGRGETAGAFSLVMLVHACFAPVTGTLIDRYGPRIVLPLGATVLAGGLVAASRVDSIWQLYLFYGIITAVGFNTLSYTPHMAIVPRWFVKGRGLASGLVLAGIGAGTMVLAPVVQYLIEQAGWRSTFLVLAGLIMVVVVPLTALIHRRSPHEVGQYPDGRPPRSRPSADSHENEGAPAGKTPRHQTVKEALLTRAFWCIVLLAFCSGFIINLLVVHQAAYLVDAGYSEILAASIVGLVGLIGSAGGIFSGFVSDRWGRESAVTLGGLITLAGVALLMSLQDHRTSWHLYAFVVLYGLGQGSWPPLQAATTGDLFAGKSMGLIIGLISTGFGLGGGLGAYTGGFFFDRTGSYSIPFLLVMAAALIGTACIWVAAPGRHTRTGTKNGRG